MQSNGAFDVRVYNAPSGGHAVQSEQPMMPIETSAQEQPRMASTPESPLPTRRISTAAPHVDAPSSTSDDLGAGAEGGYGDGEAREVVEEQAVRAPEEAAAPTSTAMPEQAEADVAQATSKSGSEHEETSSMVGQTLVYEPEIVDYAGEASSEPEMTAPQANSQPSKEPEMPPPDETTPQGNSDS